MRLYLFYTMVQKVKNDQKLNSRGPALNIILNKKIKNEQYHGTVFCVNRAAHARARPYTVRVQIFSCLWGTHVRGNVRTRYRVEQGLKKRITLKG